MKESRSIKISPPHTYLYKLTYLRIYIIIYMEQCSVGIFVINPCQSTLTLAKFMNFALHIAKKETGWWQYLGSDKSRGWKFEWKKMFQISPTGSQEHYPGAVCTEGRWYGLWPPGYCRDMSIFKESVVILVLPT